VAGFAFLGLDFSTEWLTCTGSRIDPITAQLDSVRDSSQAVYVRAFAARYSGIVLSEPEDPRCYIRLEKQRLVAY
jgi:hypothetical protein